MSGAGRERGGRTGSPPKPPAGPHLCQQRAVVLQSGSHLLLRGVQVHQDLHEPRGWGEMLGVRDRSSDPQSPPCTPRLPRAPQPLTLLMQVPQGQQALHHVRQTAGHGVPALHHLIDLVDLGDDRRCGGGSALLGRGCSPPPPHTPGSPPPPPSPCSVCRRPARRLCAWRSHSPSPGRSVGGRQMGPQTTLCPPPSLLAPAPRPPPRPPPLLPTCSRASTWSSAAESSMFTLACRICTVSCRWRVWGRGVRSSPQPWGEAAPPCTSQLSSPPSNTV